ncbi:hypothetical protein PR048_022537 [Dryococelus australis]|uniref:EXS domain-containing protein n=1 Tax=Dryococelus australis TaxID=614101 RepID=A0ABQ9H1B0_9NEOP|nr:hypothetical protein PR048_022537 [Dryococelus australis]
MGVIEGAYGASAGNERAGGNGRSPRKPANQQWRRPARFPHGKIRSDMWLVSDAILLEYGAEFCGRRSRSTSVICSILCPLRTYVRPATGSDTSQCSSQSFIVRPVVNCLPAWFRFAQCLRRYRDSKEAFPHLVNAGKYSTTFAVVACSTLKAYHASTYYYLTYHVDQSVEDVCVGRVLGEYPDLYDNPYFYMWVLASVVSTIYTYTWDIKMDWGLMDTFSGENIFLREETVYSSTVSDAGFAIGKLALNLYVEMMESRGNFLSQYFFHNTLTSLFIHDWTNKAVTRTNHERSALSSDCYQVSRDSVPGQRDAEGGATSPRATEVGGSPFRPQTELQSMTLNRRRRDCQECDRQGGIALSVGNTERQHTDAEIADMHLVYGAAGGNARSTQRLYEQTFPNRRKPGHRMFTSVDRRLIETGTSTAKFCRTEGLTGDGLLRFEDNRTTESFPTIIRQHSGSQEPLEGKGESTGVQSPPLHDFVDRVQSKATIVPSPTSELALLALYLGEPGSIPGGVASGFTHVGIVPDDVTGLRVVSGISCFPRLFILALLHTNMFYYFAIIEDLVLRFMWVVSFVLTHNGYISSDIMTSIAVCLEVFRRFLWNFFRLENEHLNNCGKFRAVRDISVAPLDSSDHTQILRMMDEENGVINRRKKKAGKKVKEDSHSLVVNDSLNSLTSSQRAGSTHL